MRTLILGTAASLSLLAAAAASQVPTRALGLDEVQCVSESGGDALGGVAIIVHDRTTRCLSGARDLSTRCIIVRDLDGI